MYDDVVERVRHRIFNLTRTPEHLAESLQIARYLPKQMYAAHYDHFRSPNDLHLQNGVNRLATVILYLNEVEDGGYTSFPYINSHLTPYDENTGSCGSFRLNVYTYLLFTYLH